MGIFVEVEQVPWKILERLRGRVLINRQRMAARRPLPIAAEGEGKIRRSQMQPGGSMRRSREVGIFAGSPYDVFYAGRVQSFRDPSNDLRFNVRCYSSDESAFVDANTTQWDGSDPAGFGSKIVPLPWLSSDPFNRYIVATETGTLSYVSLNGFTGNTLQTVPGGPNSTGWARNRTAIGTLTFTFPLGNQRSIIVWVATGKWQRSSLLQEGFGPSSTPEYTPTSATTSRHEVLAFLAGETTVRQLPVSLGLRNKMRTLLPMDEAPMVIYPTLPQGGVVPPLYWDSTDPVFTKRWQGGLPDINAITTFRSAQSISTPGIFSLIDEYPAVADNAATDPGRTEYLDNIGYARSLMPEFAKDQKFIAVDYGSPTNVYTWGDPLPETTAGFDVAIPDPPWRKSQPNKRPLPNSARLIWDWGRPDYCQTKLLELGFTAQDFEP